MSSRSHASRRILLAPWLLAAMAGAATVAAQVVPYQPQQYGQMPRPMFGGQPVNNFPGWPGAPSLGQQAFALPQLDQLGAGGLPTMPLTPGFEPTARSPYRPGFQGIEASLPQFQGFPGLVNPGFGTYPNTPGAPRSDGPPRMPPPLTAPPRKDRWPSWLGLTGSDKDAPRVESHAILIRSAERVWFRDVGETAFVPIPFYDKARVVRQGARLEVRDQGGFQMMLHDSGAMRSSGPASLEVLALDATLAEFQLDRVTHLRLTAGARPIRLRLPGAIAIELRESRISLVGDEVRLRVTNHSGAPIRVLGRHGVTSLNPAEAAEVLLAGSELAPIGATLKTEGGVDARRAGRALLAEGRGQGGTVAWYGARVQVPGGQTARFDPLGGSQFPEAPTSRPTSQPDAKSK